MKALGPFNLTEQARHYRSMFDLSNEYKGDYDMGQLIPHFLMECVPGDVISVGLSKMVRFNPLIRPPMHSVRDKTYYFFVPFRLLWSEWENFITRGVSGNDEIAMVTHEPDFTTGTGTDNLYSLWDYFALPTGTTYWADKAIAEENEPLEFPWTAYNFIWNEYFRDQTLQAKVALDNTAVLRRNWNRDYFTSALPFQQRGTAPAIPIIGTAPVDFDFPISTGSGGTKWYWPSIYNGDDNFVRTDESTNIDYSGAAKTYLDTAWSRAASVDGSTFTGVDIADLRLMLATQIWMERNARAGVRYTEYLRAHYQVAPRDDRLQRPEYLGGTVDDVIFSEVLQTSESTVDSKQGNIAGHGIAVQSGHVFKYRVQEFGLLMGLSVTYPKGAYQDGIPRWLLRRTNWDYYSPEFARLSEQVIYNNEICLLDNTQDPDGSIGMDLFGYTGRYDEMRSSQSHIVGALRESLNFWHLGRQFDPSSPPALDTDFLECNPRKDIFAVPSVPGLVMTVGNHVKALRPLPQQGIPGGLG